MKKSVYLRAFGRTFRSAITLGVGATPVEVQALRDAGIRAATELAFPVRTLRVSLEPSADRDRVPVVRPRIGYIGRIHPSKDLTFLLDSLASLPPRHRPQLFIVGQGEESYRRYLRRWIGKSGLEEDVVFTGYLSKRELGRILGTFTAVVQPSPHESLGLSILESLAEGILVGVRPTIDIYPLLVSCEGVFPLGQNPAAAGDAIIRMISLPEYKRRAISASTVQWFERTFGRDFQDRWLALYSELTS